MRKLTIEFTPKFELSNFPKKICGNVEFMKECFYEKIESIRLLKLLKLNFEKGIILAVYEILIKRGYNIDDVKLPIEVEIFDILASKENKFTCFVKTHYRDTSIKNMLKEFDLDLIWSALRIEPKKKVTISVIGENQNLSKFLEIIKKYGEIQKINLKKAVYEEHQAFWTLTNKQREIILFAKKNGYYNYPREINSYQLSEKVGISKATIIEHLRKAENRLISQILVGY
jgi:predicted DNA binding protein